VSALRKRVEALVAREAELEGLLSEKEDALAAASASGDKLTAENRDLSATLAKMKEEERRRKEEEGLLRQKLELAEDKVKVSFQSHGSSFPIAFLGLFPLLKVRHFHSRLPHWKRKRGKRGRRRAEWGQASASIEKQVALISRGQVYICVYKVLPNLLQVTTCLPDASSSLQISASAGRIQPTPTIDGLD
jgi:hypothetical protein